MTELKSEMNDGSAGNPATNDVSFEARKPMTAVASSLLMPGLGHLYNGNIVMALAWAVTSSVAGLLSLWLFVAQQITIAWIPATVVMVAAAVHAWVIARSSAPEYQLKSFNRWYVYALFMALGSIGIVGYAFIIREHYVEAFVIASDSMNPTLESGDRILVNKASYGHDKVSVGDVIVFANPEKPRITYVKRVIALADDEVQIRDGRLTVNGTPVASSVDARTPDYGPIVVPRFNCFVLGDNCNHSKDSRHFGPIPLATVGGKATVIFWPKYERIESRIGS